MTGTQVGITILGICFVALGTPGVIWFRSITKRLNSTEYRWWRGHQTAFPGPILVSSLLIVGSGCYMIIAALAQ